MIIEHTQLEYTSSKSNKFYIVKVSKDGASYSTSVTWGPIGSKGQEKEYLANTSRYQAMEKYHELIRAKENKGYVVTNQNYNSIAAPAPRFPQNTSIYLINRWVTNKSVELMSEDFVVKGEFSVTDEIGKAKPSVMQQVTVNNDNQTVFSYSV